MKHYGSMNHFNSPILDFTHINNHIDENDNIDSDIQEILQQDLIGLPIDEDPTELIEMIRSLSDSYMKSRSEIDKLLNSRDQMIEVKRLLEVELNRISKENSEILRSVQDVAIKLETQSILIEEQSNKLKKYELILKDKDDEILKLKSIISQEKEKTFVECKESNISNEDDNITNDKIDQTKHEKFIEKHQLLCGTQVCRINDCQNSDDDETEEEKLQRINNDSVEEFLGINTKQKSSSVREILEVITLNL